MKKTIATILILALAISLMLQCAAQVNAEDRSSARDAIAQGALGEEKSIDLSKYALSTESLAELYHDMRVHNDLPWYVVGCQYSYNPLTNQVTSISLEYLDPRQYDRDLYAQKLEQILAQAVQPGMSQWQIALALHDYLVVHFSYDPAKKARTAYDLLINGSSVCDGYSHAYQDLLELAGIESILCISDAMDHSWNLVRIGENWYHVDVTWDDPLPDIQGRVYHTYFLLDDDTISDRDHNHYGWDSTQTADSPRIQADTLWIGVESQICFVTPSTAYFRASDGPEYQICIWEGQSSRVTELLSFDSGYVDIGYGSYHYPQYGLSLLNGRLYYCDMDHVYSVSTDGSDRTTELSWDVSGEKTCIGGMAVTDDDLCISLRNHDGELRIQNYPLESGSTDTHIHNYHTKLIPPGCETAGYTQYTCPCRDSYTGNQVDPTGHIFNDGTQNGDVTVYTCRNCGTTRTVEAPKRSILPYQLVMVLWASIMALWSNRTDVPKAAKSRTSWDDED